MSGPHYRHTRGAVELYSHDRSTSTGPGSGDLFSLVSMSYSKSFGPPCGDFTMTLKRKAGAQAITDFFDEGEGIWVRFKWVIDGVSYDRFIGVTNSITSDVTRDESGIRTEVVTITGSDHGKIAEATSLFINIHERDGILPVAPLYTAIQERLIGSPDEIVQTLLDGWLGNDGAGDKQWLLPSSLVGGESRFFYDWLLTSTVSTNLRGSIIAPSLLAVDGQARNLWDTMQEFSNGVLNEMWFDLAPDPDQAGSSRRFDQMRPALFMRERPFPTRVSSARWDALPARVIEPHEVAGRDLVSDGGGRFNWWSLYCAGNGASNFSMSQMVQSISGRPPGQPGNVPIYDINSIRKYGLRQWEQTTRYLPIDDRSRSAEIEAGTEGNTADFWLRVAVQWLRIVHDWYVTVPKQLTGTLRLSHLRPDIRIGDKIIENRTDGTVWEYYCEQTTETYQYGGEGTMRLGLTRGQPVNSSFLAAQYSIYAGLDATTLSDEDLTVAAEPTYAADEIGVPPETAPAPDDEGLLAEEAPAPIEDVPEDAPVGDTSERVTEPDSAEDRELTDEDFVGETWEGVRDVPIGDFSITITREDPNAAPADADPLDSLEEPVPARRSRGRRGGGMR